MPHEQPAHLGLEPQPLEAAHHPVRRGLGQAALQTLARAFDVDGLLLEPAAHVEDHVHVALHPALEGEIIEGGVGRTLGGLVGADHRRAPTGLDQGLEPQHDEGVQGMLAIISPDHAARTGVHTHLNPL